VLLGESLDLLLHLRSEFLFLESKAFFVALGRLSELALQVIDLLLLEGNLLLSKCLFSAVVKLLLHQLLGS